MDQYLTAAEIASWLVVSERTVVYWAARNILPGGIRNGRTWCFELRALKHWLQEQNRLDQREAFRSSTPTKLEQEADTNSAVSLLELKIIARVSRSLIAMSKRS